MFNFFKKATPTPTPNINVPNDYDGQVVFFSKEYDDDQAWRDAFLTLVQEEYKADYKAGNEYAAACYYEALELGIKKETAFSLLVAHQKRGD